ncbi:MAG: hypothetical protein QUS66_14570, partial [Bacteroidota bacterium]|nr:hypothetical protein [Bacteroidota bacterium]
MSVYVKSGATVIRYGLLGLFLNLLFCASAISADSGRSGMLATGDDPALIANSHASAPADLKIDYMVSMVDAVNHNFMVTMTLEGVSDDTLVLKMPVWTPGYYWIQNYPKNLSVLEIRDAAGKEYPFVKTSKNVWKVATNGAGSLT